MFPVNILNVPNKPAFPIPVALSATAPSIGSAPHAMVGPTGNVTVTHNQAAGATFTLWFWCEAVGAWVLSAQNSALAQATVDQYGTYTWTLPLGVKIFLQSGAAITANNVWLGGILDPNNKGQMY